MPEWRHSFWAPFGSAPCSYPRRSSVSEPSSIACCVSIPLINFFLFLFLQPIANWNTLAN